MKSKYGFVALLDALGKRTATVEQAAQYLELIRDIETNIKSSLKATLSDVKVDPKIFDKLSIRFFGDTLLITYEIKDREKEEEYFKRISFILEFFICRALEMGLMFRGSLSIGDYMDKGPVVLGPAVADASSWYEELDMVGIILTPRATLSVKHIHLLHVSGATDVWVYPGIAVLERPPLKGAREFAPELYVLNWVNAVAIKAKIRETSPLEWFYTTMRKFAIPDGVESEFANTEAFF